MVTIKVNKTIMEQAKKDFFNCVKEQTINSNSHLCTERRTKQTTMTEREQSYSLRLFGIRDCMLERRL